MCEDIARAGNGKCLMALKSEDILAKCATLMRAGRSFLLKNVAVDWGIPQDAVRQFEDPNVDTSFHQAPARIRDLYPGVRLVVFALINNAKFAIPKTVTLRAQRDGEVLEFPVTVETVRFTDQNAHRLIHTLAARRLITELEDDALVRPALSEAERRAAIVALGETYQLVSLHTSFVAVDDDGAQPLPIPRPAWAAAAFARREAEKTRRAQRRREPRDLLDTLAGYVDSALAFGGLFVSELVRTWFGRPQPPLDEASAAVDRSVPPPGGMPDEDAKTDAADTNYDSDATYSTMSSLITSSSWTESEDSRPPTPDPVARSPSPDLTLDPVWQIPGAYAEDQSGPAGEPIDSSAEQLLQLQTAEGSFEVSDAFKRLVGEEIIEHRRPARVDEHLWATAVAVAYCRKHLVGNSDLLGCIVDKALEYAIRSGSNDITFERLVAEAGQLVT